MNPDLLNFKALLPKTFKVLNVLAKLPFLQEYTFVGGSALALYLNHRKSEDIDLFTWHDSLNKQAIFETITQNFISPKLINDTSKQQDWILDEVKVTFFANNWTGLQQRIDTNLGFLSVATLPLLCAMKVNTLFLRAKFRDYYDLYSLSINGVSIDKLYEYSQNLIPSINPKLFQMALIFTDDIVEDSISYLNPKYKTNKKKIAAYFEKEVTKWLSST